MKVWSNGASTTYKVEDVDSVTFCEVGLDDVQDSVIGVDQEVHWRAPMSFYPRKNNSYGTRAAVVQGDDLNIEEFAVSGKSLDGSYLFENYLCVKNEEGKGMTETNTDGWEYVINDQKIQYWTDENASSTFQAVAFKEGHHSDVMMHGGIAEVRVNTENIGSVFVTRNQEASYSPDAISFGKSPSAVALEFSPLAAKLEIELVDDLGMPGYFPLLSFSDCDGNRCASPVLVGKVLREGNYFIDWNNSSTTLSPVSYADQLELKGVYDKNGALTNASTYVIPRSNSDLELKIFLDGFRSTDGSGETMSADDCYIIKLPDYCRTWESGKQYKLIVKLSKVGVSLSVELTTLGTGSSRITI